MKKIKEILGSQTIKDTIASFAGLGITAVVGFIYTIILARYFGPAEFGVFSAIASLVAIIYSVGDLGVGSSLINFIPKLKDSRLKLISTSFIFETFIGLLIILVFLFLAIFHQTVIPGSSGGQIIIAGFLTLNYFLIGFIQSILSADRKFWRYSTTQIIDACIKISVVFMLTAFSGLTIKNALLANVFSTIIAILYVFIKEKIKIETNFDKIIFNIIFKFAKWIAITRVFSVFVSRIDVILLNLLSTSFQAGIYAAASRITLFFSLLISSLGSVVNPRFSSFDNKHKVLSYMKKLFVLVTAISSSMLILVLFAKPIIILVFGDKYLQAIPVFQWLTVAMIPFIFTLVTTPALIYSFNKPSFIAKLTILQVLIIVSTETLFIPQLGAFTPAIAIGLSNLITLLISLVKIRKIYLLDEKI